MQDVDSDLALPSCTLRRDEMACIKTALAMIVMKRRSQLSQLSPENTQKKAKLVAATTTQQALAKMMGRSVPTPSCALGSVAADEHSITLDPLRRAVSLQQHQQNRDDEGTSLPLASTSHWESHLQHILKLAWQGIQTTPDGNDSTHWKGLCFHVACQLEQVKAAQHEGRSSKQPKNLLETNATAKNSPSIFDWLGLQLTSCVVSSSAKGDNTPMEDWVTIWKTIIQAKPIAMSELLVPILLELLLQPASPKPPMHQTNNKGLTSIAAPTAIPKYNSTNHPATNGTDNTSITLSLEPAHLLLLFELALESAPAHVLQDTHNALSPAPHRSVRCNSAVLPSANSSWYSTQDLAYDYYYLSTNTTVTTTTPNSSNGAGQICLLRHGLAAISEALTVAMASSTDPSNNTTTVVIDERELGNHGSECTSFL